MKIRKIIESNTWIWTVLASACLWILISLTSGSFTVDSLLVNMTLASFLILLALGQMTVITSGDGAIDLSLPNTVALAAYVSSFLTFNKNNIVFGLLITIGICIFVGLLNGLINIYLRVPAIITTLAMSYIVYTVLLFLSPTIVGLPNPIISDFTKDSFLGISSLTLISLFFSFLMAFVLYKTAYGKQLRAVGQGKNIAELAGIDVKRVIVSAFVLSSFLAGITGILLAGYVGGAFVDMGQPYLLNTIAAVVVGGTLVSGGKCSVLGVVGGSIMLTLLVTFIRLTGLSYGYQQLIQGFVLVLILVASVGKEKTFFKEKIKNGRFAKHNI